MNNDSSALPYKEFPLIEEGQIPTGWKRGDPILVVSPNPPLDPHPDLPQGLNLPYMLINPQFDREIPDSIGALWFQDRAELLKWLDAWLVLSSESSDVSDPPSSINLCDTCRFEFATCSSTNPGFGLGVGNDNVISCDLHTPVVEGKDHG